MARLVTRPRCTLALCLLGAGCDGGSGEAASAGEVEVGGTEQGSEDEGETGELDRDEDGLSDAEEAELGTDPLDKDTDHDNYWDSWELIEGTDPLDPESRIYTSWWPYNPDKDALDQGTWAGASTEPGTPFPRHLFYDRHGERVDLYDFANFTINTTGAPAYIVMDVSAQWCGPCHTLAFWLGGAVSDNTTYYWTNYPSVPDKVHELRVWWMTFIVEANDKGAPAVADAATWFGVHPDPQIPVFADVERILDNHFGGPFYPFLFLLDPELKFVLWTEEPNATAQVLSYVEHEIE